MNLRHPVSRRLFLAGCGAALAGVATGSRALGAPRSTLPPLPPAEAVHLKAWEFVTVPGLPKKLTPLLRIVADNGAVGYSKLIGKTPDLGLAAAAIGRVPLLDHAARDERLVAREIPREQRCMLDIACWDLQARARGEPLHALLGTRRTRLLRYGDVRGTQPGFSPKHYAAKVAAYLAQTGLRATKLHFPGAMRTADSIEYAQVLETLEAVRNAVGPGTILAWDPYPRSAESATPSLQEARAIIRLMDQLAYVWIEGPLPPTPYETQIPLYAALLRDRPRQRIQAEGPNSSIGDGSSFAETVRWFEAGAINQCSTDCQLNGGVTETLRLLEYARTHPGLVVNLHWAWAPHAHLAMAYADDVMPYAEFPMGEDLPKEYMTGAWLLAPDWPGIYRIPAALG